MVGCTPCRKCKYHDMCAKLNAARQPERFAVCELRMSLHLSCGDCIMAGKCVALTCRENKKGRKKNEEKRREGNRVYPGRRI